jgi:hypothetical protein
MLLFQVDRAGRTVTWCPRHGERRMLVIRPGELGHPNLPNPKSHKRHAVAA